MCVLKWLQSISRGLFATYERPIFLIFDENFPDGTAVICNILSYLGGDVVSLCKKEHLSQEDCFLYDGVFTVCQKFGKVTIVCKHLKGKKAKVFKKSFFVKDFAI